MIQSIEIYRGYKKVNDIYDNLIVFVIDKRMCLTVWVDPQIHNSIELRQMLNSRFSGYASHFTEWYKSLSK